MGDQKAPRISILVLKFKNLETFESRNYDVVIKCRFEIIFVFGCNEFFFTQSAASTIENLYSFNSSTII